MRHQVFGRKLNRDIKERKALFKNLVISLITYNKIKTTIARAKAVQGLVEKLVFKAREGGEVAIAQVSSFLGRREAIQKLTKIIAPKFKDRIGGYLRIKRIGKRHGDRAEEVFLEWSEEIEKKKQPKEKINQPPKQKEV
jgi:large subunit ribosomal protein L17